jgi:hypothetical protein
MSLQIIDKSKLQLEISCENDCWLVENIKFDIHATGKTLEIALVDFSEQLTYFYYHYRELSKSKCLKKALALKLSYQETFKDIL